MLEREVISAVKLSLRTGEGRLLVLELFQLDLLKTGVLASLYRLEGASDAAGEC